MNYAILEQMRNDYYDFQDLAQVMLLNRILAASDPSEHKTFQKKWTKFMGIKLPSKRDNLAARVAPLLNTSLELYRHSHLGLFHIHTAYLLFAAPALRLPSMQFTLQCEPKIISDRSRQDQLCNLWDDISEYEENRQSHDVRSDDEAVNENVFGEGSIAT
ncbi:hypothetical protein PsorP6_011662 [Peronosclerospora sorghi]|uniref:Uncharacterized protein n=1 Tax=Peronosclerospora sorghi TaxID=230839 RepID=A0ACC0WKP6_9STRA|nr:hypothetical protein PsorP6_011662 [Peronosclerospora sorghi]